jgi:GxxExxY protein
MLIHEDQTYAILGACFAVYRSMGCGFLEAVYQECLAIEFGNRGIPFVGQSTIALSYNGTTLSQKYVADFVCYGSVIVELKAVASLGPEHHAQVLNYLKATGMDVALLVNFGSHPKLEHERIACTSGRYGRS